MECGMRDMRRMLHGEAEKRLHEVMMAVQS